jgi:hypothetical protein
MCGARWVEGLSLFRGEARGLQWMLSLMSRVSLPLEVEVLIISARSQHYKNITYPLTLAFLICLASHLRPLT